MAEDLFDIVDENNQPLGFTKTRSEAHQGDFWHRTVHLYLVNEGGISSTFKISF